MNYIYNYLVFPGFLFAGFCGMLASFIDRKITARLQWRKGPPLFQPFYDFIKLLGKETVLPSGVSKSIFLISPLVGLSAMTLVSTILWLGLLYSKGFAGDLLVLIYLMTIPSISVIIAGFSSKNPIASIGASREMKLILGYELPFIFSILVVIIKANSIKLSDIINYQILNGPVLNSISGVLAFIIAIFCIQAKMGIVPFDISEAEQEIIAGPFIEYSGPPLGIFKLTRWMMLFVVPSFIVATFFPAKTFSGNIFRYLILLVIVTLIRNTNPRIRIDQAIRFFWVHCTVLSFIAVILALFGK